MVEQEPFKLLVLGSSPRAPIIYLQHIDMADSFSVVVKLVDTLSFGDRAY